MSLLPVFDRPSRFVRNLTDTQHLQKRSLETYRVLTSPLRMLPEFLIIGVQKGGTTSLYRYLEQHPCVAAAFAKEVHFFDNHTRDHKFGKGMAWYRSHFAYSAFKTYHQYVHHQTMITGEGSPEYIFDPHAPQRIAAALPQVKLIALLRNPVDRAYSHYLHNTSDIRAIVDPGREPLLFEEAIAAEPQRLQGEKAKLLNNERYFSYSYTHHSYLQRGIYADQLKVWFDLYPREQILILQSEPFFADPGSHFKQVLEFLGLPSWEPPAYKSHNIRRNKTSVIAPETREQLVEYFEPHNQRLYHLLGTDLGWD